MSNEESLISWKGIYAVKREQFLEGDESVDNFIQAFRTLVDTKQSYYKLENNYFDLIRDLDYVCGDYFTVINLTNLAENSFHFLISPFHLLILPFRY